VSRLYPEIYNIFTHLTKGEKELLFELAAQLPESPQVVEIGSYIGASTCFLAAGARSKGGKVVAVDTWTNIAMSEGPRDTYQEFLQNIEPFRDCIVVMQGESQEIGKNFFDAIDLLFIDGDHSYEGVCDDVKIWLPKVKDNGLVVFHDYSWADGVQRAIKEFILPIQIGKAHIFENTYWTRIRRSERT